MALTVIEGSWDEIQQRAAELQGRRLRVIVLPESETPPTGTLYEFLGDFVGCIAGSAEPLAEQSEQAVENLIAAAYRSQGLDV